MEAKNIMLILHIAGGMLGLITGFSIRSIEKAQKSIEIQVKLMFYRCL